mmetsp:Transcript_36539/g.71869  ORF Transcript_36539/g.71869 Transcript_36539/m.71869 type:complete len:177 (+) Transcript_36539:100-630(+)
MVRAVPLLLGVLFSSADAFVPANSLFGVNVHRQHVLPMRKSVIVCLGPGSAGAIAKPKVKIGQVTATPKLGEPAQQTKIREKTQVKQRVETKQDVEEAKRYKLNLLGDDAYDFEHVVDRLENLVPDVDKAMAVSCFNEAQAAGLALIGVFHMETAELYKEQLIRSEPMIYADMQEE